MANRKLTVLPELTAISDDDFAYIVDVSDTSESPDGTSKKTKFSRLKTFLKPYFDTIYEAKLSFVPESRDNKQNSLADDGTATKYPTVDAVNAALYALAPYPTLIYDGIIGVTSGFLVGQQIFTLPSDSICVGVYLNGSKQYKTTANNTSLVNRWGAVDNVVTITKSPVLNNYIYIEYKQTII